ncbi:Alpha/beta hydrolase family [Novymonas esmeraldas]|uniref:Alpha/beta hydrolase family n=1 Tax=Novymonas esmeraldas TaxID=1808958 RepID=A0AAW0EIR2_9TRYP
MYAVLFTVVHVAVHVLLYAVPRWLCLVCVRWPVQALSTLLGVNLRRGHAGEERRIRIFGPVGSPATSPRARTRDRLGVTEADLSNPVLHHDRHDHRRRTAAASAEEKEAPPSAWLRYCGPLYNGHIHTILGAFRPPLRLREPEREVVASYDGNPTCLDWWWPTNAETAAAAAKDGAAAICVRALVVILPGLTGSSKEFYVRRMARQLLASNMAVCVLNARGVADTPLEQPQIFSALFTKDLRHVMQTCLTREKVQQRLQSRMAPLQTDNELHGAVPIIGVAFSLGGLILTNYVSEQGEAGAASGFDVVYSITSPHNVSDGAAALRVPLTRCLYDTVLYKGLYAYYERHKEVLQRLPGIDAAAVMGGAAPFAERLRTVQDFDEFITGPHFGFAGAEAYYAAASNFCRLHHSHTPQMCLVAANDPICGPPQPAPRWLHVIDHHRGGLVYVEMPVGGHLGFLGCPWREWVQAPNVMEEFVLRSMTSFVASCEAEAEAEAKAAVKKDV